MKKLYCKLLKWLDLNICWMFINGNKENEWCEKLREKYGKDCKKSGEIK